MLVLDYNKYFDAQQKEPGGWFKFLIRFNSSLPGFFRPAWIVARINKKLTAFLLEMKGFYAYLQENTPELKNKDLTRLIAVFERALNHAYDLQVSLEHPENQPASTTYKSAATHSIVREILSITHDIVRLLKKLTRKTPITLQSDEAKAATNLSKQTISEILSNGH